MRGVLAAEGSSALAGEVKAFASRRGGFTDREWGMLLANKIIEIADAAAPPIRDQAHAFKRRVEAEVARYVSLIKYEERSRCAALASSIGQAALSAEIMKGERYGR